MAPPGERSTDMSQDENPASPEPPASNETTTELIVPAVEARKPTSRRPSRPLRVLGSLSRIVLGTVFVAAVGLATLAFLKVYVHARRHVTPIIVTPSISYDEMTSPPFDVIFERMKEMVRVRMGWAEESGPKLVAFTFDDGPYAMFTPQLLDVLRRNKVKATFFIIGKDAQMQPELVRRIVAEGHEIGNHSYNHPSFVGLDEAGIRRELGQTDTLLRSLTGISTPLVRPPGGRLDASRLRLIHKLGYTVVNDNDNPGDYQQADPLRVYTFTLMHSSRRTLICMHSGRLVTIRALPTIIAAYRDRGYKFVTVSELAAAEGIIIPPLPTATASK